MRAALILALAPCLHGQPAIITAELPRAAVGSAYQTPIETIADPRCVAGGGITLTPANGELPAGLRLRAGEISGVPAAIGVYQFGIRASTLCGSAVKMLSLTVTGRPILRVIPEELIFEYHAGGPAPPERSILLSGTWPDLPYSLSRRENAPWLEYAPFSGATPSRDSAFSADTVTIRVNPAKLAAGTYQETLRFAAWQSANTPQVSVTLKVY